MSGQIVFENIRYSLRRPGVYSEYNLSLAALGLPLNAQKVVILGQKTTAGTATAEVPVKCFSAQDAETYSGVGSVLDLASKAAYASNPRIDLDIVPIDDAEGTAATGTIVVSGICDATGYFDIWIGNVLVQLTVEDGDAVNDIAAALNAAIQAKQHLMPVTSGVSTATVTLTARNDGLLGNSISIAYKNNGVGTTDFAVVQVGTVVAGLTDPSIANALAAILPGDYDIIINTLNDATNLGLLKTHLVTRSAPEEDRPAVGIFGYVGVQATLETLAGTTMNSGRMLVGFHPYTKTSENGHSLDYEIAGALGAMIAFHEDPALPYNGRPLAGIAPAHIDDRLSGSEQTSCLENGVTPLLVNGETVVIQRAISTYTTNAAGVADGVLLDITTIRTLDYVKLSVENRQKTVFQRAKGIGKTRQKVRTQVLDVLYQLEKKEIVEKVEENKDFVIVNRNSVDPTRFDCRIPVDIVTGLHIIANRFDLYL
jgi:phage tail sheath gpL-like